MIITTEELKQKLQRHQLSPGPPQVGDFVQISDHTEPKPIAEVVDARRQDNGTYKGRFTLADTESGGRFMAIFFGPSPHVVWEWGRKGDTIEAPLKPTDNTKEGEFWVPLNGQTNQDSVPIRIKARVWRVPLDHRS